MTTSITAKVRIENLKEAKKYLQYGNVKEISRDLKCSCTTVYKVMNMCHKNRIVERAIIAKAQANVDLADRIAEKYLKQ